VPTNDALALIWSWWISCISGLFAKQRSSSSFDRCELVEEQDCQTVNEQVCRPSTQVECHTVEKAVSGRARERMNSMGLSFVRRAPPFVSQFARSAPIASVSECQTDNASSSRTSNADKSRKPSEEMQIDDQTRVFFSCHCRFEEECTTIEEEDCKTVYDEVSLFLVSSPFVILTVKLGFKVWEKKCEMVNVTVPQTDCREAKDTIMETK